MCHKCGRFTEEWGFPRNYDNSEAISSESQKNNALTTFNHEAEKWEELKKSASGHHFFGHLINWSVQSNSGLKKIEGKAEQDSTEWGDMILTQMILATR